MAPGEKVTKGHRSLPGNLFVSIAFLPIVTAIKNAPSISLWVMNTLGQVSASLTGINVHNRRTRRIALTIGTCLTFSAIPLTITLYSSYSSYSSRRTSIHPWSGAVFFAAIARILQALFTSWLILFVRMVAFYIHHSLIRCTD